MPTASKDLYEILGVDRNASENDIKKAFRRRARDLHPDVNDSPNADEEFKELNEAYDVLSDPAKRAQYDRFGTIPGAAGVPGGGAYVDFEDLFGGFGGMGDIFSSFFGGAGGSRGVSRERAEGRDMGIGIEITLEEAATGLKREIVYDRLAPCSECDSTGVGVGGGVDTCRTCNGTGSVVSVQQTFLGNMQSRTTCPDCNGEGKTVHGACEECDGQGRVPDRNRVAVEIPEGIQDGQQLRISGQGEAGVRGADSGDLLVTVRIAPDKFFERSGSDLHASLPISMLKAALGAKVIVDGILPDEKVEAKIPAGTQPGDIVRIKGRGMPKLRSSSRGDLMLHVDVVIPKKLKSKQKRALQNIAKEMGDQLDGAHLEYEPLGR